MMVSRHIAFSLIPAAGVYMITNSPASAVVLYAGAVLIDFDHYLDYAVRNRDLSLRAAYRYGLEVAEKCMKGLNERPIIHAFHTVEFFILMAVAASMYPMARWLLFGMLFHIGLDYYEILTKFHPGVRSFSLFWYMLRSR